MTVEFRYHHPRAKKARLAQKVTSPWFETTLAFITLVLIAGGAVLFVKEETAGSLLLGIGIIGFMLWQWIDGELKQLAGRIDTASDDSLELALALDPYVLARLPADYSLSDVLIACSGSWQHRFFANRFGVTSDDIVTQVDLADSDRFWSEALTLAREHHAPDIDAGMLFVAAVRSIPGMDSWLSTRSLGSADITAGLHWQYHLEQTISRLRQRDYFGGVARDWSYGYTPLLNQFGHNISLEVQTGGFIHRDLESHRAMVDQMVKILSDTAKPNVVLVGDVGVGKSTTVYALAKRMLTTADVPKSLQYQQIFSLSAPTLVANAGGQPGQLERLMIQILNEVIRARNIILFLDDAGTFFGSGQSNVDLSTLIMPVIEGGRVRILLSLTPKEWQAISGRNEALGALFNTVAVKEPDTNDTMRILEDQILLLEGRQKVIYSFFALKEAIRLGERYVQELAFPGKALRLLEQAATYNIGGLVSAESVQQAVEQTRGVKVVGADVNETDVLLNLEDRLHERLINQVKAVSAVANALRRSRSGVGNPNRPVGTFLFLGPTGVGKTELSKTLADLYFGGEGHLIRVDMNEFANQSDTKRFISSHGRTGLSLIEQMRKQPYSVVLLDELEKAHPDVLNVLLQLLDEGRMRDEDERDVSFRDAIIIATSNAGAEEIRSRIERGEDIEKLSDTLSDLLISQGAFKPEFLNRFDEIVVFRPLSPDELLRVVDLLLNEVNATLADRHVTISLTDNAKAWLVKAGYDPRLGARPLRRMVQRSVENVVAKKLLSGELISGGSAVLDVADLETGDNA